jgi:hypothetical protein
MAKLEEEQLDFMADLLGEDMKGEPEEPEVKSLEDVDTSALEGGKKSEETLETKEDSTEVKTESEASEEEGEEEKESDTIASLRAQIMALSEMVAVDPLKQTVQAEVPTQVAEPQSKETTQQVTDFLSADELDRLIDEPGLINVAFQRALSSQTSSMQATIAQEVNKQIMINRAVTDFYSTNQDLLPYSKFVQFVMTEVEQTNRDKPYSEIFKTTANECRKRLGLSTTQVVTRETNKGSIKPAFAGSKKGNSRPTPTQEFFDNNALDVFNLGAD